MATLKFHSSRFSLSISLSISFYISLWFSFSIGRWPYVDQGLAREIVVVVVVVASVPCFFFTAQNRMKSSQLTVSCFLLMAHRMSLWLEWDDGYLNISVDCESWALCNALSLSLSPSLSLSHLSVSLHQRRWINASNPKGDSALLRSSATIRTRLTCKWL